MVVFNNEEAYMAVKQQIKSAKDKGLHKVKVKVYQSKKGKPLYIMSGMIEGGLNAVKLEKEGFSVSFTRTDKSITSTVKNNNIVSKVQEINTTNMIVRW